MTDPNVIEHVSVGTECSQIEFESNALHSVATNTTMPIRVVKDADEAVNNSNTLQDDNKLLQAVGASEVWYVFIWLRTISATATPDIKVAFTVPAAGSFKWAPQLASGVGGAPITLSTTASYTYALAANTEEAVLIAGIYIGGANAGNLQLQWAQVNATAEDTKILANSFMLCYKLA